MRFRNQRLGDSDLMRFSRQFGELDWAPIAAADERSPAPKAASYIMVVSNVVENGQAIGQLGAYEAVWHTDMSYTAEAAARVGLLYSLEVPEIGGDTGFSNMYRALETLPGDLRREIEGRKCRHDASRNSAGEAAPHRLHVDAPDPSHTVGAGRPIERTHPMTGRQALFLGRRSNAYIPGLPLAGLEALLEALWAHASRPDLAWCQRWQVGDLIMWDNRCAMHRRDAARSRRAARRAPHTQVKGDKPI